MTLDVVDNGSRIEAAVVSLHALAQPFVGSNEKNLILQWLATIFSMGLLGLSIGMYKNIGRNR
jgi:hypothetical protein